MQLKDKLLGILLMLQLSGLERLQAVEKYWMARNAQLVVVGRLINATERQQGSGWLIQGSIVVTEVLFGPGEPGQKVTYRFLCSCCPKPDLNTIQLQEGLWFLNEAGAGNWTTAGSCEQPGYRPIRERDDIRQFLKSRPSGKTGRDARP